MNKLVIILAFCFSPSFVYAYLDPGSTSIIIQAVIGAIASGIFFIKMFWFKIKKFIKDFFNKIIRK